MKPISSWIKFKVEEDVGPIPELWRPLLTAPGCIANYTGSILETPEWYYIISAWEDDGARERFCATEAFQSLLHRLSKLSNVEPKTFVVDFQGTIFWPAIGKNTEIRTVSFPSSISPEQEQAILDMRGLTMPHGLGIGGNLAHLSPYRKVPMSGWKIEQERDSAEGFKPCIWINSWVSPAKEKEFKESKRRVPPDGEDRGPLIVDVWDQELRNLGAIDWEDAHVDFILV